MEANAKVCMNVNVVANMYIVANANLDMNMIVGIEYARKHNCMCEYEREYKRKSDRDYIFLKKCMSAFKYEYEHDHQRMTNTINA